MSSIPVDVSLPHISTKFLDRSSGLITEEWYDWAESLTNRVGGSNDVIAGSIDDINSRVPKTTEINTVSPLAGGGPLTASLELSFTANPGWTASTGTANKGSYATYAAGTASGAYVPAELQSVMDALQAATRRIKALEDALFDRGVIIA